MFVLFFPEELIRKNSNKQKYGFLQLNATSVPLRALRGIKLYLRMHSDRVMTKTKYSSSSFSNLEFLHFSP